MLYNGIVLPDEWPPANRDPESSDPMVVPYIETSPAVIPIDVGRQLFVDDFLVGETDMRRCFHSPVKYDGNPILSPTTPAELRRTAIGDEEQGRAVCYLGHGGVMYDASERVYKMFYTAGWRGPLALAVSEDGLSWTRSQAGPGGENIVWSGAGRDNAVWLDSNTGNATERFKVVCERSPHPHTLHTSPDGQSWTDGLPIQPGPLQVGFPADYTSLFWNPFRRVWVFSIKQFGPRGRCRYYSESPEFTAGRDWSRSVYWTNADNLDQPDPGVGDQPQLYSLTAVAYESLMIGMHYVFLGPSNETCARERRPKIMDLHIGFSRDGFHWHRPSRSPFIASERKAGVWDGAYLHSTTSILLVSPNELLFPYCGFSGFAPDGERGMYHGGSIGIARMRRDGFASMRAGESGSTLVTRPVQFRGTQLFVNLACSGEMRVEALDKHGQVIQPHSLRNCVPIRTDSTCVKVVWQGVNDLSLLRGRSIRFRFQMSSGDLFAFWTSENDSGSSGGYLAAGGAAYHGYRDTTPDVQGGACG